MARGGSRSGAGRKKGQQSQKTTQRQELTERALATGKSPLEIMLENMNWAQRRAEENSLFGDGDGIEAVAGYRKLASDWAKDAAPYIHPKLSTVEHKGQIDGDLNVSMNDKELARKVAFILARADPKKD